MDQSSNDLHQHYQYTPARKTLRKRPEISSNDNHSRDFFLNDNSKAEWSFDWRSVRDWTMDCGQKASDGLKSVKIEYSKWKSNLFKLFGFVFIVFIIFIVLYHGYHSLQSVNIKEIEEKLNFVITNLHKIEDDMTYFKQRLDEMSDLKLEPTSKIEKLIKSAETKIELFAIDKTDEIMVSMIDERKAKIDSEISGEIMNKLNEKLNRKVDLILEEKLKKTNRLDLDLAILNNTIQAQVRNLIQSRVDERKPDYASELNGARVLSASSTYAEPDAFQLFSIPLWSLSSPPSHLLKRNSFLLDESTKPWKMNGQEGFIRIKLGKPIIPISFAYEHVIRNYLLDENQFTCSPKVFRVFGYENDQFDNSIALGKFNFEINENTETEFLFDNYVKRKISFIQFNIESNHGNPNHTCLHRIKVF